MFVRNLAGAAEVACLAEPVANAVLQDLVERVRRATAIDAQIAVVLATAPIGCDRLFYVPIANDLRGIGYQHGDPREVFDDSPESRLEGIAFLNDIEYWRAHPKEFAGAFNHELGHRWLARVHARLPGQQSSALLGRQELHWSYFLDSQGSPLEGNLWTPLAERRFSAYTPTGPGAFSGLDLYLMGLVEPGQVGRYRLLVPSSAPSSKDCRGAELAPASPPQSCAPVELDATELTFGIDDVVALEGSIERARDTPQTPAGTAAVDVAVILLGSGDGALTADACAALSNALDERFAAFEAATGDRLVLRNLTRSSAPCRGWKAEVREPPRSAVIAGGGCAMTLRRTPPPLLLAMFGALGYFWLRISRRRLHTRQLTK